MSWTETDIPPQTGRRIIVTGTGGLGYEAARALSAKGADVILAGRNPTKGQAALDRIRKLVPDARLRFEPLDLASLASVREFAARLGDEAVPIDVLINNAGVAIVKHRRLTADGFELQLGTNHLGHFALTMRLMPLLLRSPAPRVVSLSSSMHKRGKINFDDLQSAKDYSAVAAYGQSKLATLMFALELDARMKAQGLPLISAAAHPGIARTELMNNGPAGQPILQAISHLIERIMGQSAADGTLPVLRAATDPAVKSGTYFGPAKWAESKGPPVPASIAASAQDKDARARLWQASVQLTGVDLPEG